MIGFVIVIGVWLALGFIAAVLDIMFDVIDDESYSYSDVLKVMSLGAIAFVLVIFTLISNILKQLRMYVIKYFGKDDNLIPKDFWTKPRFFKHKMKHKNDCFDFTESFPPESGDGLGDGCIDD